MFPGLANFPLYDFFTSWREKGRKMCELDAEVWSRFWNGMKRQVDNGTAPHSWGKEFVKSDYQKHGIDELGAIYAGYFIARFLKLIIRGTMIEGGSETTSQALNNTLLGLLSNPGALKAAQEELDRVVGSDRTPTLDDEPNLPFVRAISKVRSH